MSSTSLYNTCRGSQVKEEEDESITPWGIIDIMVSCLPQLEQLVDR
jgi:hypothetical protein